MPWGSLTTGYKLEVIQYLAAFFMLGSQPVLTIRLRPSTVAKMYNTHPLSGLYINKIACIKLHSWQAGAYAFINSAAGLFTVAICLVMYRCCSIDSITKLWS